MATVLGVRLGHTMLRLKHSRKTWSGLVIKDENTMRGIFEGSGIYTTHKFMERF